MSHISISKHTRITRASNVVVYVVALRDRQESVSVCVCVWMCCPYLLRFPHSRWYSWIFALSANAWLQPCGIVKGSSICINTTADYIFLTQYLCKSIVSNLETGFNIFVTGKHSLIAILDDVWGGRGVEPFLRFRCFEKKTGLKTVLV